MIAGLGVSGPQIVEGWYGQPWGRPYYRLKDYVQIMKKVFARDEPVTHNGKEFQLPYHGPGSMGIGKPLKSILHMNPNIPVWLGSGTETNVRMAAEVADGILPLGFVPQTAPMYRKWVEEGFARAGNGKGWKDFEMQSSVTVIITDDLREAPSRVVIEGLLARGATISAYDPVAMPEARHLYADEPRVHFAADALAKIPGVSLAFDGPFFNEFALRLPMPAAEVNRRMLERGYWAGFDLGRCCPGRENELLVCVTETKTAADIESFARSLAEVLS